jgi:prepilin-type N-terminal cleavage/methylation domain-containing protein
MKPHNACQAPSAVHDLATAFTLIELLVVIAVISILAGLAFPAVNGALGSSKKAQARNDVNQLAAAIKAFQLEYGRLPSTTSGSDAASADNAAIISALTTTNPALNPRGIVFFEPKIAKAGKGGLDGAVYKDPWGMAYAFALDTSYDNRITADVGAGSQNHFTTVIVQSGGPDANLSARTDNISNVR